jgi:IS30 family transposase
MSKKYKQLSSGQRYQIEALLAAGTSKKEIASIIGTDRSTIHREIKRNTGSRGLGANIYRAKIAVRKTCDRHTVKNKRLKFSTGMKLYCEHQLKELKYSPELISVVGNKEFPGFVSHETIYKWIWQCKAGNRFKDRRYKRLYLTLRHGSRRRKRGRKRDMRGIIANRVSIEKRPKVVAYRKRIGDLEVDLMLGKNHKSALLVTLDRATLRVKMKKILSKSPRDVNRAFKTLYQNSSTIRTITFDNDQAFSGHTDLASHYKASTYFTRPYTSQDKGSVENRIGIIRRFLPKKTDLNLISEEEICNIEDKLNNRPVRKFKYKTPNQVFAAKCCTY